MAETEKEKKEKGKKKEVPLDQMFGQIDQVIEKLETGENSLEDSFQLYKKGMDLLKTCSEKIDTVEKQMQMLDENGETHEF